MTVPTTHVVEGTPRDGPGTTVATSQRPNGALAAVPSEGTATIAMLLQSALERGTPVEQLDKLVDLYERMDAREAAKQFSAALASFQAECPLIRKTSTANVATKSGGSYSYTYAELDEIVRTVGPLLAKNGLSYSWDTVVGKESLLTCVCTLRHIGGHSNTSTFTLPIENASAMSPQQKVGAADTFAKRRTLSSVLGLTTTDADPTTDDANPDKLHEDQVTVIEDLLRESGAKKQKLLEYMSVERITDIRAVDFRKAENVLKQYIAQKQRRAGQ